jgi:phage-related protein
MTAATFTWYPDSDLQLEIEPRVQTAKFGDGYEQRTQIGLNPIMEQWQVVFTGLAAEINAIDAFLRAQCAWKSFIWKNPNEVEGRYLCRKWSIKRARGVKLTLTGTFEQVPE